MRPRIAIVFAILMLTSFTFAQGAGGGGGKDSASQPGKPAPPPAAAPKSVTPPASAATNAAPPMPKPEPEMERLTKFMAGRWDVDEEYADTPMTPGGGKGKGISMVRPGPGNLSVINEYRGLNAPGMVGHGMMGWSPREKAYVSFWMDNGAPGGSASTGRWKGDDLVFDSVEDMNGQKIQLRMTYTDIKPDSFTLNFDSAPVGKNNFSHMMTFKFTRNAGMMGPRFGPRPMRGTTPPPGTEPPPPPPQEKPKP